MRLRRLADTFGADLEVTWRAFALRPEPVPGVAFRGTYREAGWRRCHAASTADGIAFNPWPHAELPGWSLPALEAAKCAATQGEDAFARMHLGLFEAYFTKGLDISHPDVLVDVAAGAVPDVARFSADLRGGTGRAAVLDDLRLASADGVRAIPTVVFPATGQALVGLLPWADYVAAAEAALAS